MESEKWRVLKSWFYNTGHKSPWVPAEVRDAIETLLDERESEENEEEDGTEEDE
jgi:hypothetical protein